MNSKITELAKKFKQLKTEHDEKAAELKAICELWSESETELLEAMGEEGVKTIKIDGLGAFTMRIKNYLSVNAASKPQFYLYLKRSGNGDLLKEEVNPKTLTAFLNGHLEDLIKHREEQGLDQVDARNAALKFLNEQGASYFTERGISLRSE